jgi:hypothetical protein
VRVRVSVCVCVILSVLFAFVSLQIYFFWQFSFTRRLGGFFQKFSSVAAFYHYYFLIAKVR